MPCPALITNKKGGAQIHRKRGGFELWKEQLAL